MSIRTTTALSATQDFLAWRLVSAPHSQRDLLKGRIDLYKKMRISQPYEQALIWQGIEIPAAPVVDNAPPALCHLPAVSIELKTSDICNFQITGEICFCDDPAQLAQQAQGAKEIEIEINSCGGNGEWAHKFGQALRKNDVRIVATILHAHSAAISLAQYCDWRRVYSVGSVMVHDSQYACFGSAQDFRRVASWLDTFREADVTLFSQRTKQSREVVERWLSSDTHFTPAEALAAGLVDEVISSPP